MDMLSALRQTHTDMYARPVNARIGTAWLMLDGTIYFYDYTNLGPDLVSRKLERAAPSRRLQGVEWELVEPAQVVSEYLSDLRGVA